MPPFRVTYERWTESDYEAGDTDSRGFLDARGIERAASASDPVEMPLRDAIRVWGDLPNNCSAVEPSASDPEHARWMTAIGSPHSRTGIAESRSLHFPATLSSASRARLVRLLA